MRRGDVKSTQPQGTASVQSRKAQTYVPVREKVRSQPGREDHQAYRKSKGMRTFFNDPKKDKQVKQGTTAYLKFPVESEGSDLLSFLKSRVSKRTSLEIHGFLQFEGVLVVVIIT